MEGFVFNSKNIFDKYIETLNKMKLDNPNGSPRYIIGKMLMISLYGRFAMDPYFFTHPIVDNIDPLIPY